MFFSSLFVSFFFDAEVFELSEFDLLSEPFPKKTTAAIAIITAITITAIIIVSIAFLLSGVLPLYLIKDIETATSEFNGLGATAIPAIVVYAAFNTAFPEELLFRGFLLKRLANKFGFNIANLTQALLFGLLHGVMFFSLVGAFKAILIVVLTGAIAWLMGYINEKHSNGSIVPSWIIHTIANLFSGICAAFSII